MGGGGWVVLAGSRGKCRMKSLGIKELYSLILVGGIRISGLRECLPKLDVENEPN